MLRLKALFSLLFFAQLSFAQSLYEGPPVFHGAKRVGNYPNTEFIFTIPATGERPISFSAENLPQGLAMDAATGIIRGTVKERSSYAVKISASNAKGKAEETLRIEIGDTLCLTPPMGWNSWNVFTKYIDEAMLLQMADAMVSSGMRDLGYQYINIDDYWHDTTREADGRPRCDPKKFPHGMKYVADYMHARGLKLGIYSCAGSMTCGRCFGGYSFEEIDAKTYAEWGIDLLKYDYCYAPWGRGPAVERYTNMGNALKKSGRSIVLSVCEWGLRKPWKWAQAAGGSYWRTTPDIFDIWKGGNLWTLSVTKILKHEEGLEQYAGPGHWNDPDMLLVGNYGKGHATSREGHFAGLTDVEYQSHMSLWAMLCAPLLSSCDLRSMNEATKNILLNGELLAINQDALGEQASLVIKKKGVLVYRKHLSDGSIAVALLNTSKSEKKFSLHKELVGPRAQYTGYDIWQRINCCILKSEVELVLQSHQTIVIRFKPSDTEL